MIDSLTSSLLGASLGRWLVPTITMCLALPPLYAFLRLTQVMVECWKRGKTLQSVPGPSTTSFLKGNIDLIGPASGWQHTLWNLFCKYGSTVQFRMAHHRFLLITKREDLEEIIGKNSRNYEKHTLSKYILRWFIGEALLIVEGEHWQRQRKTLNPAFHFQNLNQIQPVVLAKANEFVKILEHKIQSGISDPAPKISAYHLASRYLDLSHTAAEPQFAAAVGAADAVSVDLNELFPRLTLDVLGVLGFGHNFNQLQSGRSDEVEALAKCLEHSQASVVRVLPEWWYRDRSIRTAFNKLTEKMQEVYEKRVADGVSDEDHDLMALMMRAQKNGESWVTRTLIMQEMLLFFFAGTDTTSSALAAACYCLAENPETQEKLIQEIDKELQSKEPSSESTRSMPFLNAVINETLRLYPSAPSVTRTSTTKVQLSETTVEPGIALVISPWVIHRNPEYWGEDADKFRPERWIEGKPPQFAFLPFLWGARNCIGQSLAILELRLILVTLFQKFRFRLSPTMVMPLQSTRSISISFPTGVHLIPSRR